MSQHVDLEVAIDGRAFRLRLPTALLNAPGGGAATVELDGKPQEVDLVRLPAGAGGCQSWSLLIGGRQWLLTTDRTWLDDGSVSLVVYGPGGALAADVRDQRRLRRGAHGVELEGRVRLKAPMAGRVVKILSQAGDTVETGAALLVLEAMKMQNEVRSPKAGRLVRLAVAEGEAVATGQLLAEVE